MSTWSPLRSAASLLAAKVPPMVHYALALLGVAAATWLALAIEDLGFNPPKGAMMLTAIMPAIWYGGRGPGAVAVVASTLSVQYFLLPPRYSWEIHRDDYLYLATFFVFALLMAWFASRRRLLEAQLLRAHEELRAQHADVLDITHDAIFMRNLDGAITYWNRAAAELFGYPAAHAMGRKAQELLATVFPDSRERVQEDLLRAGHWEGKLGQHRRDGGRVDVYSRWSLQHDATGRAVAILESNNDVTEQMRHLERIESLNQELQRRGLELQASNKELEAFAYSVSHDLRAPLRHIAAYAELLQKSASATLDEKSRRHLANVVDASRKMGALIDDLLAFSRIGRAEARMTMLKLDDIVREVLREVARDTEGRDVRWNVALADLPEVRGDRAMLRLALLNLVANAVKFTRPRASAQIDIGTRAGADGRVVAYVRDNGVGFDMQYVHKLFGVFQRLHAADEFEGTGIGLATVQRIIARHGGEVWAEGALGHGATFYFSLPTR
jgi:PAS domain S-box-containing protein